MLFPVLINRQSRLMSHSRKYPDSWVWVHDLGADDLYVRALLAEGEDAPELPEPIQVHPRDWQAEEHPCLACVRTMAIAEQVAARMKLVDPYYRVGMPYNRKLCKTQWWERHPERPYRKRRR